MSSKHCWYYVDATGGSDANHGRSPDQAWQTIGKVNGFDFAPADRILFKRGETWTGTSLMIPSSGEYGSPIIFGAYGTGADPVIDGNDAVDCIICTGQSYIQIENIEVTQGLDLGVSIGEAAGIASHHVDLFNITAHDCGDDNISLQDGVHDCNIYDLVSYNPYQRVVGPTITCLEISDDAYNILVDGAELYGSAQVGMSVHAHLGASVPWNVTVRDVYIHDNTTYGIVIWNSGNAPASPSITFSNCQIEGGNQPAIYIYQFGGAAIPSDCTFEDCSFGYLDAVGVYVLILQGADHYLHNNLILGLNRGIQINDCPDLAFYNNTIYITQAAGAAGIVITGTNNNGTEIKNTIDCLTADNYLISVNDGAHVGLDIDYNLYYHPLGTGINRWLWRGNFYNWANWLANSGQDANSPMPANPTFTDPASGDFTLLPGSPAINQGLDVGLPYCGLAPDCGAYEYCP